MNATADHCQEKAGFLFSHACSRAQELSCDDCGKQVCTKHSRAKENHTRCITCAKKKLKMGKPTKSGSKHRSRHGNSYYDDHYYYDDPYFYGSYYYDGYGYYGPGHWGNEHSYHGHDHDDFTEADGGSMLTAEAESFEHDAAAS